MPKRGTEKSGEREKSSLEFNRRDVGAASRQAQSVEIAGQARNDTRNGRNDTACDRRATTRPPTRRTPTPRTTRTTTTPTAAAARRRRKPLLVLSLLLAMVFALAAGGTAVWAYNYNNSYDLSWYLNSPDSTEFTISTNGQFHAFSALVNGDAVGPDDQPLPAQSFAGKTVRMSSGLNLFDIEFTPIGTEENPFAGTFVGKSIQRLKISSPASLQNVGLFGYTSATAQIQGVQLAQNCNITLATNSAAVKINNVGGIVGNNNGSISDCSSAAKIVIAHNALDINVADGNDGKPVVNNIGGVVGNSTGNISNTSHSGKLELSSPANAYNSPETLGAEFAFNLYIIENVGGVVGNTTATITATQNSGSVYAVTTGGGARDRFNMVVSSRSHHVGGIVGNSVADISFCSNSGNIFTTGNPVEPGNPQADFDQLGREPSGSAVWDSPGGAAGIGGIVGNFRHLVGSSEIAAQLTDPGMLPGAPTITVSDCTNTGFINGCHVVGGIVGGAGSNTVITRCSNGVAGKPDIGTVRSTRWNKPCTGGIVSQSTGVVSYSRNHALVTNTSIGHYNGGIAGLLAQYDRQPFRAEIFGCYNTGPVVGSWSGGLVGRNYAYVHDNTFLYGVVGYTGADADQTAVFANHSMVVNSSFAYETQAQALDKRGVWIKSGEAVAILNQLVPLNGWTTYYFIAPRANNGYPVLNGQAPQESATDLSQLQVNISLAAHASYAAGYNPTPALKANIVVNGRTIELKQGVDFRVLADPEAVDADGACKGVTNDATPYLAGIEGIGLYSGSPAAKVAYGILKADLSKCRLVVSNAVYNGQAQNHPNVALLDPDGVTVPDSNYSLEINNGNDCLSVTNSASFYPVTATAYLDSNYSGLLAGRYDVMAANVSTDCDLVGIYLEGHTVNGQPDSKSIWFFDDLQSKIYEVTPLLAPDGNLQWVQPQPGQDYNSPVWDADGQLLWQLCAVGEGVILVEGLESYQQEGERPLLRATPKQTAANGGPAYGGLAVDYTGEEIQPRVIAMLFNGSRLSDNQYNVYYGYYSDGTVRPHPHNTNATTNDSLPEASIVVRGQESGNFRNYDYIDFMVRPVPATDGQLAVHYKDDQTLAYASGACPAPPARDASTTVIANKSVDLRFYPDPDELGFKVVSADQWYFEFHHAIDPDGQPLAADSLGYLPGSKVYYAIKLINNASLVWQGELLTEYTVTSPSTDIGDEDKVLLSDAVIEVVAPTVYDPAIPIMDWIDSIQIRNRATGELLKRGQFSYTPGTDYFYCRSNGSHTEPGSTSDDSTPPTFNPDTGMLEGRFTISGGGQGSGSKYLGLRTVTYQCQRPPFPMQDESLFTATHPNGSLLYAMFTFSNTNVSDYKNLPWCEEGWSVEQLQGMTFLAIRRNNTGGNLVSWRSFEEFRPVAIYLGGQPVEKIAEFDKTYTVFLSHVYRPESSIFANGADPDTLYQFPVKLSKPQTFSGSSMAALTSPTTYTAIRGCSLAKTEYMYTGFDLRNQVWSQLVILDAQANQMAQYFEPVVIDTSVGGHGNIKDVYDYNVPVKVGNRENIYPDLHFTGDGLHFGRQASPTAALTSSSRTNWEIVDGVAPTNLRFSIVPADISDPQKVRIELDTVAQTVSFFDAQSGDALNYLPCANGLGDYLLSWGSYSAAQGYARITTSGNGNLMASAACTAYQVTENPDGSWTLDILYAIDAVSVDLGAASWDYAARQAVPASGVLALPAVVGSYDGTTIPDAAYRVRLGTWDGQGFSERLDGWAAGQTAYLYIEPINDLVCYGSKLLSLELVAPDPGKQFGPDFAGTVNVADTVFSAKATTPELTVSFDGLPLVQGRDYQLSCDSVAAGAGAGSVVVSGLGEYTGSYSYTFDILPAAMDGLVAEVAPQAYSGGQIRPSAQDIISLVFNGVELAADDWALDADGYAENINVATGGTLTLLPGASDNFSGSKQAAFAITPKAFADSIQVATIDDQHYLGLPITFTDGSLFTLTDSDSSYQLVYGQDFVASSYANNRNVGSATVYFSGKGNYAASSITASFNILPAAFVPDMVHGILANYEYQGTALRPTPQLLLNGQQLPTSDYQLEYGTNDGIGINSGWLKVTPVGDNLSGDAVLLSFDISADISRAQVEAIPNSSYTPGGSYQPDLQLAFNGQELVRNVHYTVQYGSYGAGTKTLTVTGIQDAAVYGSVQVGYAIDGRALTAAMITAPAAQGYTGHALQPQPLVKDGDTQLQLGLDYLLSYSNNTNVSVGSGRAVVTVSGIGNYAGLVSANFDIDPKLLDASGFTAITAAGLWPGSGSVAADLVIYDQSIIIDPDTNQSYRLVEGRDYTVSYQGNNAVGTATATVSGIGNYSFQWVEDYLVKGDIAAAQLTAIPQQAWTGAALEPALELRLGGQLLALGSDYQAAYSNNIDSGTALVTVSGLGLYQGSLSASFVIAPPVPDPGDDGNGGNGGGNGGNGGGGGGNTYNNYYYGSGSGSGSGTPDSGAAAATSLPQQPNPESPAAAPNAGAGSAAAAPAQPDPTPPLAAVAPTAADGGLLPLPALIIAALLLIVVLGALARWYLRRRRLDTESGSRR